MPTPELEKTIQQQANQCVKCGLCLPHCPTYVVTENECESPRGRIALMDALAKQQIPLSAKTQLYLDHCLTCRACEAVCPAQVPYGELIDNGRQLINAKTHAAQKSTALTLFTLAGKHPWLWRALAKLLFIYQRSGLQSLIRKSGLLKLLGLQRAESLISTNIVLKPWHNYYPAITKEQGRVALFTGCINQLVDQITIKAAIKILTACGFSVYIPSTQRCCGALQQHAGLPATTQAFLAHNVKIFNTLAIDKIITITTGCAATLQEYEKLTPSADTQAFTQKIIDINQFLTTIRWPEQITFKALPKKAILHTPCTLRNVLKQPNAPWQLLQKIPALEIILLKTQKCCGAAGLYMLQHPMMADSLLTKTLDEILPLKADYLITTNIGCSLHLQKGIVEYPYKTAVLHPIVLIAQQLLRENS